MKKTTITVWFARFLAMFLLTGILSVTIVHPAQASNYGDEAWTYLNVINNTYPGREAGNANSRACGDWIIGLMQSWGYQLQVHNFTGANGNPCRNLIFVKQGTSAREIVFGAHYDSDVLTKGADDNGSGVAVVLETAQRVANMTLPCTVRFIFWDDEESGTTGSVRYLQTYGVGNAMCIINVDCVAAGDCRFVHGGGGPGEAASPWLRDLSLQISGELGLGMTTHAGLPNVNDYGEIPAGTRVTGSDQQHWAYAGIPYIYCEASLYSTEYGNSRPARVETGDSRVPTGQIMHTPFDDLGQITGLFGTRTQGHLSAYVRLCYELLTRLQPDKTLAAGLPAIPPTSEAPSTEEPTTAEPTTENTTEAATEAVTEERPSEELSTEETSTEPESTESLSEEAESAEKETAESPAETPRDSSDTWLWIIAILFVIALVPMGIFTYHQIKKRK